MNKLAVIIAAGALLFGVQAKATPINGSIQFVGTATGSLVAGTTTFTPSNPWHSSLATGDYASVPFGTAVTKSAISYTGTGLGATLTAPVNPEWTFTLGAVTYSFDLSALDNAITVLGNLAHPLSSVIMSGTGTAHITGFTDTAAIWSLQGTGTGVSFNVASQSTTATGVPTVPDGGMTAMLLGAGLLGVAGLRRKMA